MQVQSQFSAFLENKPGRLAAICSALAKEKISLQAITIMKGREHSVLRFVPDDPEQTRAVLTGMNLPFSEDEVVAITLKHQPGTLAQLCERLAAEHINIDYLYCSGPQADQDVVAFVKATPRVKLEKALREPVNGRRERAPVRRAPVRR